MDDRTVKIDGELLARVEKLVKLKSKHIRYSGKKQFVNIAVQELLEKEEKTL